MFDYIDPYCFNDFATIKSALVKAKKLLNHLQ